MGDALKFKRNEDKVLEEKSLLRSAKAVYDKKKLQYAMQNAMSLLKKLAKMAGGGPSTNHFFKYHKAHVQYLAQILYAVGKMEPIEQEIEGIRMNIDGYLRDTGDLTDAAASFPADPLSELRNPIVILEIAGDPAASALYDGLLDNYQQAAELAIAGLTDAAANGRGMEQDTRAQAQAILDKLLAMKPETPADQVFIGAAKKRVEFIQFDLMTKVQDMRARAEAAARQLEPLLADVRQIDRIGRR
ncbi:hypothetical protein [Cohnella sp. JJ-181]|uniref:hypothetical protein n=1 Tax=Cohnella rhizoplanae TaxID=2974897 RepID=UPI0022FF9064|nr:hypothetical protein [Cohnella sp. JJ-181]CAI6084660.1 hypothetical protein COHCIP112018_04410 [Cohnella sp. JJ-181]